MLAERALSRWRRRFACVAEATALRMMLAATVVYGKETSVSSRRPAATPYTSTYPYNPTSRFWTNSLFENRPADAMGVRADGSAGMEEKRL